MAKEIYYSKSNRKEVNGLLSDNREKRKLRRKGGTGICQKGYGG